MKRGLVHHFAAPRAAQPRAGLEPLEKRLANQTIRRVRTVECQRRVAGDDVAVEQFVERPIAGAAGFTRLRRVVQHRLHPEGARFLRHERADVTHANHAHAPAREGFAAELRKAQPRGGHVFRDGVGVAAKGRVERDAEPLEVRRVHVIGS